MWYRKNRRIHIEYYTNIYKVYKYSYNPLYVDVEVLGAGTVKINFTEHVLGIGDKVYSYDRYILINIKDGNTEFISDDGEPIYLLRIRYLNHCAYIGDKCKCNARLYKVIDIYKMKSIYTECGITGFICRLIPVGIKYYAPSTVTFSTALKPV